MEMNQQVVRMKLTEQKYLNGPGVVWISSEEKLSFGHRFA